MKKLLIQSYTKFVAVTDYVNGEDTDTEYTLSPQSTNLLINSIDTLANEFHLPTDKSHWFVYDADKLLCQTLEDENGNKVEIGDENYLLWQESRIELYACSYYFTCKLVDIIEDPEIEELSELLNIECYD